MGFDAATARTEAYVIWYTPGTPSTTQVRYGTSPAMENMTVLDSNRVENHGVTIPGLDPGTTYYFQAVSVNESGYESTSGVIVKTTKP